MNGIFDKLRARLRGELLLDEPLKRHTSWRIGGPADAFIVPADRQELALVLAWLREQGIPWLVIGAGSNLLVRDGGIRGAVLQLGRLRGMTFEPDGLVVAEGGVPLMTLLRACVSRGLAGLEGLAGIPGTLGGGVAMNAGAGGQDLGQVVRQACLLGPDGPETWDAARLAFGYRRSAVPAERIVLEASLVLQPVDPAQLQKRFAAALQRRQAAQRVSAPNAGSVFKNPPGGAAWKLVDAAGLRGVRVGQAQVAEQHANFIVNRGGARSSEVLELMELIRHRVLDATGIELVPEVRVVGED